MPTASQVTVTHEAWGLVLDADAGHRPPYHEGGDMVNEVIQPAPRPMTFQVDVIEGVAQDEQGNTKVVKFVRHMTITEWGTFVAHYPADFANALAQQLLNAQQQAKSGLTIAKDIPPSANGLV